MEPDTLSAAYTSDLIYRTSTESDTKFKPLMHPHIEMSIIGDTDEEELAPQGKVA